MFAALKSLFSPAPFQMEAHHAYAALVAQSRRREFYERMHVPDTLDGRFDLIVLHLFLLISRLREEKGDDAPQFIRAVSEAFFDDMDRSLREMGVSDTGVGKRIKKMSQAFFGRLQAYEHSFHSEDAFAQSLLKNLYRLQQPAGASLKDMVVYCNKTMACLHAQPTAQLMQGQVVFLTGI